MTKTIKAIGTEDFLDVFSLSAEAGGFTSALMTGMMRSSPEATLIFGAQDRFNSMPLGFANQSALSLTGLTAKQLSEKTFGGIFEIVDEQGFAEAIEAAVELRAIEVEARLYDADSTLKDVVLRCACVNHEANMYLLCFVRPVLKQAPDGSGDPVPCLEDVGEKILRELHPIIDFRKATVQLVTSNERVLLSSFGFDKKNITSALLKPVERDPVIRKMIETRTIEIISNTDFADDFEKQEGTWDVNSWMGIPLIVDNGPTVFVTLDHDTPGYYGDLPESTLQALRQFQRQVARDIHNVTLQRQLSGLKVVQSVGREILRKTEVDDILKEIVDGAVRLTSKVSGVIVLVGQSSDGTLSVEAMYHPEGQTHPQPRTAGGEQGLTRRVIEGKELIEIPDTSAYDINPELVGKYLSIVAIPLIVNENVVGVLFLNGQEKGFLTEAEKSLVSTLADQAAIVIDRARLYQRHDSLLNNIPQCVFRKDLKSRFTWANAAFCRDLGVPLDEIIGKTDYDFYPAEMADKFVEDDCKVIESGEPHTDEELNQPDKTKPPIWVKVLKTPVRNSAGVIEGVQTIFWDINEEKTLKERDRSLVEYSPDGIVLHKDGAISLANPAAMRLFGVDTMEALDGRSMLDFIHPNDRELAQRRIERMSCDEEFQHGQEMKIQRCDGENVNVVVNGRRLPGKSEIMVVFHDLTQEQHHLREMHHRIMRALTAVSGFLDSAQERLGEGDLESVLEAVDSRIQAMARLHRILYQERGESSIGLERYLEEVVVAAIESYWSGVGEVSYTIDATEIKLDEQRLSACALIVNELVTNSLIHGLVGKTGGCIGIRISHLKAGTCTLVVEDSGCGLATTEHRGKDSMGLEFVESLVRNELHGQLKISTQAGCSVRVDFPLNFNERS